MATEQIPDMTLKQPFLHHMVIFKDSLTFFMLSTGLLMQGQIFSDSHRHCAMRAGGENALLV